MSSPAPGTSKGTSKHPAHRSPAHRPKTKTVAELHVRVEQQDGFEFRVRFDNPHWPELLVDEPPPLGKDAGPNASRMFAATIGQCLGASLLFCLARASVVVRSIDADVFVEVVRNERHRLRIPKVRVVLWPAVLEATDDLSRCIEEFQDHCIVTESVRQGVRVDVEVQPIVEGMEGPTS